MLVYLFAATHSVFGWQERNSSYGRRLRATSYSHKRRQWNLESATKKCGTVVAYGDYFLTDARSYRTQTLSEEGLIAKNA